MVPSAPIRLASVVSMRRQHDRHRLVGLARPLDQRFDRDLVIAQAGRDLGQHARPVDHHQPKIVGADMALHRCGGQLRERAARHGEHRRARTLGEVAQVGDHRRGGRRAAGAAPGVERRADLVRIRDHRVQHAFDLADRLAQAHHAGMDPLLEAVLGPARDAQQLDPIAHLVGKGDVERRDVADALGMHGLEVGPAAERQRRQQGELVRRIDAVDVEARIGLGIAQTLRFGEHLVERAPALAHVGEDVVAGAVQDAVDPLDPVAGQALAQGLDDRDAAGHGGLETDRGAIGLGEVGEQRRRGGRAAPCWR